MEGFDPLSIKQQIAVLQALQQIATGKAKQYPSGVQKIPLTAGDAQRRARMALHDNGLTWPQATP